MDSILTVVRDLSPVVLHAFAIEVLGRLSQRHGYTSFSISQRPFCKERPLAFLSVGVVRRLRWILGSFRQSRVNARGSHRHARRPAPAVLCGRRSPDRRARRAFR